MKRPRIKRTTQPIISPEGDIYLMRPSAPKDIRVEQPNEEQRALLEALDGEHTIAQLADQFDAKEVHETISQLIAVGVLEDAADDERIPAAERGRFDRQLRYFSDVVSNELTPSDCQQRLREAKVAVLGVGGLGAAAAWSLASVGVGELWLVDGDRVELSNLNRQTTYTVAEIGLLKVEVAAARLRAFNPEMRVTATARRLESEADVADFIASADVVVDSADWPPHDFELWCNAACFAAGIPFITMSHFPPVARAGPFFVPGITGCYVCQETSLRRVFPLLDVITEQQRLRSPPAATLGPACTLIGGHIALDVMHLLTGLARPSTLGTAHISDLRTMSVKREPVVPEPGCPVCGHFPHDL